MHNTNLILATDSYKLTHWKQYPEDTEAVYSYFESRVGAKYPYTVFFGLQYILQQYLVGRVVTLQDVEEADNLSSLHFSTPQFNREGWEHIVNDHDGRLPLRIKAVPEGTIVPTGNVMMTVENTCPKCFWLTNAVESLLTHVWYPSTVATMSRNIKEEIAGELEATGGDPAGLEFMLHDFGYRGVTTHEAAEIGGAGHLVNFKGTDTLPAMLLAIQHYSADPATLAFSVPATEHSVMTSEGQVGEMHVVERALKNNPSGILSVVADSFDIYGFVESIGTTYKEDILARDGVFVVRPDSVTLHDETPAKMTLWVARNLWSNFGGTENEKGFKVLDPHVRVLYGDGIDQAEMKRILDMLKLHGFAAENVVFGMGGGLLQKVNRDTQRFAFKCSAIKRSGKWQDTFKRPLDGPIGQGKESKRGRLSLSRMTDGRLCTTHESPADIMKVVFEDGEMMTEYTFDEVRENARL